MEEIEIDLPQEVLFTLMMEAHKRDITLNQLINDIIKENLDGRGRDSYKKIR